MLLKAKREQHFRIEATKCEVQSKQYLVVDFSFYKNTNYFYVFGLEHWASAGMQPAWSLRQLPGQHVIVKTGYHFRGTYFGSGLKMTINDYKITEQGAPGEFPGGY